MVRFLNLIAGEPDIARVPIMVDSSKWSVIEAGLKCIQGKGIVNSISMKEGEAEFKRQATLVRPLWRGRRGDGLRRQGPGRHLRAQDRDLRARLPRPGRRGRLPPEDIIFDPNIFAIATGIEEHNNYAVDFIEATRWIKQHLPGAKVSGGVSNVSFQLPRQRPGARGHPHRVPVPRDPAGMDMGIVNAGMVGVYDDLEPELRERVEDVVLNRRPDAGERLVEIAETAEGAPRTTKSSPGAGAPPVVDERLSHALVHGITDFITADTEEAWRAILAAAAARCT
jgi:5-methyltetrahydrofolate--homocysteine methyltransferase